MTSANRFVYRYLSSLPDLTGKTVVDIPCGDGRASHLFLIGVQRLTSLCAIAGFCVTERRHGVSG